MTRSSLFQALSLLSANQTQAASLGQIQRTVSRVDPGEGALGFAQHDGDRRVVLLHDRVGSREEGPATEAMVSTAVQSKLERDDAPRRGAVFARLAEEEADLLQALGERISARHLGWCVDGRAGGELVFNWSSTSWTRGKREAGFPGRAVVR